MAFVAGPIRSSMKKECDKISNMLKFEYVHVYMIREAFGKRVLLH